MDKRNIKKDLIEFTGGKFFINQTQLMKFMGISNRLAREIVQGLDYERTKKERKYYITDVAHRIFERGVKG